jgi:hypothetical protein
VEKVFEYVVFIPFVVVSVEEKVGREIRRRFPYLNLEVYPGTPDELCVVEDVVGSSELKSLEMSGLLRLECLETPHIHLKELKQVD